MEPFVDGFVKTDAGYVPRVRSHLVLSDRMGTARARIGYKRSGYKVVPGLYCVGNPEPESPVLVTANYKLSFDSVRTRLTGIDAWLLVVDTRGINVWCAAGKNLFATHEITQAVTAARLHELIAHRELILPQLGATGVSAHKVKKECGFSVLYGPVRAEDIPAFLRSGNTATEGMRMVTFTLEERIALIPVELFLLWKLLVWTMLAAFLLSGIGPDVFSTSTAWDRGLTAMGATLTGILTGCAVTPIFLNQLPGRQFWPKGAVTGVVAGTVYALLAAETHGLVATTALILWTTTVSSFLAMNFTGSTPYTSPSGVEKEMRRGIPVQAIAAIAAIAGWLAAPFLG